MVGRFIRSSIGRLGVSRKFCTAFTTSHSFSLKEESISLILLSQGCYQAFRIDIYDSTNTANKHQEEDTTGSRHDFRDAQISFAIRYAYGRSADLFRRYRAVGLYYGRLVEDYLTVESFLTDSRPLTIKFVFNQQHTIMFSNPASSVSTRVSHI